MKLATLITTLFAALLGVTAHAQIITNYGQSTYGPDQLYLGSPAVGAWDGTWDGAEAKNISAFIAGNPANSPGRWIAQTFIAPTSGSSTLYAYNFQLAVANASAKFTTAVYVWDTVNNTTLGSAVAGTAVPEFKVTSAGFNIYGLNTVTVPGVGVGLTPGTTYALLLNRTDTGTTGTVQYGYDSTTVINGGYAGGTAYKSTNGGSTYSAFSGDMAFWISFDPASLSPVPEPAVNGAIIGGLFVSGLLAWRRYGRKSVSANL